MNNAAASRPKALVLCERSLTWATAFANAGYSVDVYDLLPPLIDPPAHVTFHQQDARSASSAEYSAVAAFPPCTHLSAAGAVYWPAKAAKGQVLDAAALFLSIATIAFSAPRCIIENPRGLAFRILGRPSLIVHPHMYALTPAENRCKRTAIWLNNWPPPMQTWSDSDRPRKFMSWAAGRCQVTRSQSWPGMAAAFVGALS